jgi:hypothetical protein
MSYITKPIFSDDNKGDPKYMWKDPLRMDKWLLQPLPNHKHVHLEDENGNIIKITVNEYNYIQNQSQMIFCSANNWPVYCIEFVCMKSEKTPEKDIINLLKSKYQD